MKLNFAEAEAVGERLHDHWQTLDGCPPFPRRGLAWADLVQATLRFAREAVALRQAQEEPARPDKGGTE